MQYTIRAIPVSIDHALRSLAKNENKSLNEVVIEALARDLELDAKPPENPDLEALIDWHGPPFCSAPWWGYSALNSFGVSIPRLAPGAVCDPPPPTFPVPSDS